jgi:hypothetical protein
VRKSDEEKVMKKKFMDFLQKYDVYNLSKNSELFSLPKKLNLKILEKGTKPGVYYTA